MLPILHICLSSGWGGLEMYPVRIGAAQVKRGLTVYGLALKDSRVAHEMKACGIEVLEFASRTQAIWNCRTLLHWLRQRQIALVHCHKSSDLLLAAILKSVQPFRLVFTEHMGGHRAKKDLLHRWIYRKVDLLLAISEETKRRNLKALPIAAERVQRLWLGTDLTLCQEDPVAIRQALGLPLNATIIGILGRIDSAKGQRELLDAIILLKPRLHNVHLLIVGGLTQSEGSDEQVVQQLRAKIAHAEVSEWVHLVGFRHDTARMLRVMDIVAIPSHNEAFGLTVIEAMAAGKPIVGANTGAIPEILTDTGLLVNPTDPEAIADQLTILLNDARLREQLAQRAYSRACTEFGFELHLERLLQYYNDSDNTPGVRRSEVPPQ